MVQIDDQVNEIGQLTLMFKAVGDYDVEFEQMRELGKAI